MLKKTMRSNFKNLNIEPNHKNLFFDYIGQKVNICTKGTIFECNSAYLTWQQDSPK